MLRISWVNHVTNDEVMNIMEKVREIINTVKIRNLSYFSHVRIHLALQGNMGAKRGPGRRRIPCLMNLMQWFGQTTTELFRAAVGRVKIANIFKTNTAL